MKIVDLLLLACAAAMEAGGDALVRSGLRGGKAVMLVLGATILFGYGVTVNLPKWDFSRLMGVYICFFFVVSQVIAVLGFHEKIKTPVLVGGAFIVVGGLVMTFWHSA